ncbi:hypothetical protein JZ751_001049 [Albula glossodonta]|uniref:Uncharacterized protein n=1 Tax=Albula glossodonta TaxID=121402 RepID=A0A8T2PSM2_9TELE|nr:hypothetical protein JZ751_001049 [Albula glossodonta]
MTVQPEEAKHTFRSLRQGHAQPVQGHTALAADGGGAAPEGVEGDGTDDQRQVEGQVHGSGDVHIHLQEYSTRMMLQSKMEGDTGGILSIFPFHVSVLPEDSDSPRRLATSCLTSFIFPLA